METVASNFIDSSEDRVKLSICFDPERLREDLLLLEGSDWIDHFVKQNYEGAWRVVPLRAPAGETHPIRMIYSDPSCKEFIDTPLLKQCAYFREVLAAFQCQLNAVRLMKLTPGSLIKEHTDHDLSLEQGMIRLHIPVQTNPGVAFFLNGKQVVMQAGECWYLRLSDPHRVANHGLTDRVHLVIDCVVNDWLRSNIFITPGNEVISPAISESKKASAENLEHFIRLVLREIQLQNLLRETSDPDAFFTLAVQLGRQHGYHFTVEQVKEAVRDSRRAWYRKWDKQI